MIFACDLLEIVHPIFGAKIIKLSNYKIIPYSAKISPAENYYIPQQGWVKMNIIMTLYHPFHL